MKKKPTNKKTAAPKGGLLKRDYLLIGVAVIVAVSLGATEEIARTGHSKIGSCHQYQIFDNQESQATLTYCRKALESATLRQKFREKYDAEENPAN